MLKAEMIPNELKLKNNWVLHNNKIPIMAIGGSPAASNDPTTWCSYFNALASHKERGSDGIGFMFEPPYIGIDLDDCVVDGKITPFGNKIIETIGSYTEYSPSGTGIHIICKGILPSSIKTKEIEAYQTGRYFTMTGNRISNHSLLRWINDFSFLYPNGYKGRKTIIERLNSIQEGNRNNTLTGIAGSLRNKGYKDNEIFEILKPRAIELNFPEKELWTICQSVGRYPIAIESSNVETFLENEESYNWIIQDVLAKETIGFVSGLPESRKTWLLMDLALECAKGGGKWLGRFPVSAEKVLFIDQERPRKETQRRFRALMKAKGITGKELKDKLFIKSGTTIRLDLENSFQAFKKDLTELNPSVILIDSFATFHTKNEKDRMNIQPVLEKLKELRNQFKCTFLFIDHENKMAFKNNSKEDQESFVSFDKLAGSVAKSAAAETIFTVRHHDEISSFVHHTKSTVGTKLPPFLVKVEDVAQDKSEIKVEAF